MKIVIPGGTGQVGRILCRAFASAGDEVVVLSTIYAHRFDAPNDEFTGAIGGNERTLPTHGDLALTLPKRGRQQLMNPVNSRTRASSSCAQQ